MTRTMAWLLLIFWVSACLFMAEYVSDATSTTQSEASSRATVQDAS